MAAKKVKHKSEESNEHQEAIDQVQGENETTYDSTPDEVDECSIGQPPSAESTSPRVASISARILSTIHNLKPTEHVVENLTVEIWDGLQHRFICTASELLSICGSNLTQKERG